MKNFIWSILVTVFFAFATITTAQQNDKTEAILKVFPDGKAIVEITLGKDDIPKSQPTGGLFSIEDKFEKEVSGELKDFNSAYTRFHIDFPSYNPSAKASYEVLLLFNAQDENDNPFKRRLRLPVKNILNVELAREPVACSADNNLQMIITTPIINSFDWQPTYRWFDSHSESQSIFANVTVKQKGKKDVPYKVVSITRDKGGAIGNQLGGCLVLDKRLPDGTFDAVVSFSTIVPLPSDIKPTVTVKKLDGTFAIDFPEDEENESPDKRKLENTLDLGITFISSVSEEEVSATTTSPATTVRKRKSRGIFDIGFEFPEVLHPIYRSNEWMTFLTPFYLNAIISTGKIEKDTLSQNRILFGFQGESRYRQRRTKPTDKSYVAIHRLEWGLTHASDRDFKQNEIYASISYKPLVDKLFKPYSLNYKIDENNNRVSKGYGFTFVPMIGFDFGRTYSRRNPSSALESSALIRRLNFGLNLGLDITSFVSLSAENTLYVRWEKPQDRLKNLFKAQGEFKLFRSNRNRMAHSLFITFEKGQGPPFATPDANSVRIGYRVIGNFCGIYCR